MPATASPFDALPATDALDSTIATLPNSVALPQLDVSPAALGEQLSNAAPTGLDAQLRASMPDLSGAPSPAAFQRTLDEPLAALTSVDGASLVETARTAPPPALEKPTFDANGVVGKITGAVLPGEASATPMKTDLRLPSELGDFSAPLRRLGEAGAATPLRLLQAMLTVLDRLVDTATDVDRLKAYTTEALGEILVAQCTEARGLLPLASLEEALAALDGPLVDRYEQLLVTLDRVKASAGTDMLNAVESARTGILPPLAHFARTTTALRHLKAGETAALDAALKAVVGFATSDEVFLKGVFEGIETRIGEVLDTVAAPIQQLVEMIGQIQAYLQRAAATADEAARTVAKQLEEALETVGGYLTDARKRIEAVAAEVKAFVARVDVTPAVEAFKRGCAQVVSAVDSVFTQVERVRQQLDEAVQRLTRDLEKRFDEGLAALKDLIEKLLKQITDLLSLPEVKRVLDEARGGVEKLKTAIDQASLQAVFDLVVRKTGELEGRVRAIDTAKLGTPQKTALKVGVKVIEAVDVDDVLRPELEAAFAEILGPLRELIDLLKDRVLEVERRIDTFNPGTVVLKKVAPYLEPVFATLDAFRPSELLEPVKDGLEKLQDVLQDLDPQRLLDRLQAAYGQLVELVDALEPAKLNGRVVGTANRAIEEIEMVRDWHLSDILRAIRENVSLRKLLEGTGIQEIADAELWDRLRKVLGGEYLTRLTEAMGKVEARLTAEFATLDYAPAAAEVARLALAVEAQTRVSAESYRALLAGGEEVLGPVAARLAELERRRRSLVESGTVVRPEVEAVLRDMALAPLIDLVAALRGAAGLADAALAANLEAVKTVCAPQVRPLKAMKEEQIRAAVPAIFKTQFGNPVRGFVTRMQVRLQPFEDAVTAIQEFVTTTLIELPKQVDAAVGLVLDAVRDQLHAAAEMVIGTIRRLSREITSVISTVYEQVKTVVEQMNPTLVLNSFTFSDFNGEGDIPAGLLALSRRIVRPGDDEAAALLAAKLTADQLKLVESEAARYYVPVLAALNASLRDERFGRDLLGAVRARLDTERKRLEGLLKTAEGDAYVTARKALIRTLSLGDQLTAAQRASTVPATRAAGVARLNRVVLEIQYPEQIRMGLQALHPYVVEMVGQLYPAETVARIDKTYVTVVDRLHWLPISHVQEPLDEAFDRVKTKLHETFDIRGLFRVLDIKLEGMEDDLSVGLDRLSVAYDHLLGTLDSRLSG